MKASRFAALSIAASLLIPVSVTAEVRLKPRRHGTESEVLICATTAGPWSPLGPVDEHVLNPLGDRIRDGAPHVDQGLGAAVVSWVRPADATVRVVEAAADGWRSLGSFPAEGASGTLEILWLEDAPIVLWQQVGSESRIMASEPGIFEAVPVSSGHLLAAQSVDGQAYISRIDGDGRVHLDWIVMSRLPFPPIDIERELSIELVGATPLGDSDLGFHDARGGRHGADVLAGDASGSGDFGLRRPGGRDNHAHSSLFAWWSAPGELSFVELTGEGPLLPVETLRHRAHGAERPRSLLSEAKRIVRARN